MAAITNTYVEVTADQTTQSESYVTVPGATIASGNFTAGKQYLFIITAEISNDSANGYSQFRCIRGAGLMTGSEMKYEAYSASSSNRSTYSYMTVFTAVAGQAVSFQFQSNNADDVTHADSVAMFVMELDTDLAATDWAFNENTTGGDPIAGLWRDGASVSFTSNANEDWLLIGHVAYDVNAINNNTLFRLNIDNQTPTFPSNNALTYPSFSEEGEDTFETATKAFSRGYQFTSGSHSIKVQLGWDASQNPPRHTSSRVFALRLPAFEKHAFDWDPPPAIFQGAGATIVSRTTVTPTTTSDYLMLASAAFQTFSGLGSTQNFWIEHEEAGDETFTAVPAGTDSIWSATIFDLTDARHLMRIARANLSAGGHSAGERKVGTKLQRTTGVGSSLNQPTFVAFSMELAPAGGFPQTLLPSAVALSITAVAPTVATGAVTLTPTPVSLPLTQPNTQVAIGGLTVTPTPVSLPLTQPATTVSPGEVTLFPTPVSLALTIAAPVVSQTGATQTLYPSPVSLGLVVAAPTVAQTLLPTPVSLTLTTPAPTLSLTRTVSPTPVSLGLVVAAPDVVAGAITLTPTPVSLALTIPVPSVDVAEYLTLFGDVIWRVDPPNDYPAAATLRIEVVLSQDSASNVVEAQLYNASVGVPISGTRVTSSLTDPTFLRSASVALSTLPQVEQDYQIQFGGDTVGGTYTCHFARIRIEAS